MPKYSFAGVDVTPSELTRTKRIAGPQYSRRVEFFRHYFPVSVARAMALRWNISSGAAHYSAGIMKGVRKLEGLIREAMKINRVGRGRATGIVWSVIAENYRREGVKIETSSELFQNWIEDNVSP